MKRIEIVPHGFACRLVECPPGFFVFHDEVCFKTEYGNEEAYCSTGEVFWGGCKNPEDVTNLIVQPCILEESEE